MPHAKLAFPQWLQAVVTLSDEGKTLCPLTVSKRYHQDSCTCHIPSTREKYLALSGEECTLGEVCQPAQCLPEESQAETRRNEAAKRVWENLPKKKNPPEAEPLKGVFQ